MNKWVHYLGTVISCTVPAMCVGSGEDIVVTCTRSQDLTEQTRIKVDTEDGSAIGMLVFTNTTCWYKFVIFFSSC